MGRVRDRGEHLRGADVGAAGHADFAVRIGKSGGPFDSVVAVGDFVAEGVELAVGGVAAADVLHDHDVAVRGDLIGGCCGPADAFVVGRAHQDDGEFSFGFGAVDVGAESDAVAGFHVDAGLDDDFVDLLRGGLCGGSGLLRAGGAWRSEEAKAKNDKRRETFCE